MELTFLTDLGHSYVVEIDPNMELENVMALVEAEVSWEYVAQITDLTTVSLPFRLQNKASPIKAGN